MLSLSRICCMAAMAPALTDATAHSSSFKLPASPAASPGQAPQTGVHPIAPDPSSPGLPNGRTDIGQTAQLHAVVKDTSAALQLVRTANTESSINNNLLVKSRIANSVDALTSNKQRNLCNNISNNHQPSVLQTNGHPKTKRTGQSVPRKQLPALRLINGVSTGTRPRGLTLLNMNKNHMKTTAGRSTCSGAESTTEQPEKKENESNLKIMPSQASAASCSLRTASEKEQQIIQQGGQSETLPSSSSVMPECSTSILAANQSKTDISSNVNYGQSSTLTCDNNGNNTSDTMSIEFTEEQSECMAKQQMRLEQRARWLASRLRRLQSQQANNHVQKQFGEVVGLHHAKLEVLRKQHTHTQQMCQQCKQRQECPSDGSKAPVPACMSCNNIPVENPTSVFQRLTRTRDRVLAQRFLRGEDRDVYRDVKTVSRKLHSILVHVDKGLDSDATDESSGGESCDEGDDAVSYDNRMPQRVPLHKRAIWKWAMDRAAIASKWTWLQAQVSDLEYRIRQQSDIYRQIRATKGVVTLGEPLSPEEVLRMRMLLSSTRTNRKMSPIEAKIARLEGRGDHVSPSNLSTLLTNVTKQSARLKRSLQNCITPIGQVPLSTSTGTKLHVPKPMNGLVSENTSSGCVGGNPLFSNPSTSTPPNENKCIKLDASTASSQPVPPEELYCARTRPVKYYRKRKLIRTLAIHQQSRKAQKLSTVRCSCNRPSNPCVMCGGRFNHVRKIDLDVMSYSERVAHVDFSFHPVLSLPQEIPLSVHYESLLKSGEWQRKPKTRTPKKYRLWSQSRLGNERRKDRSHEKARGRSRNQNINRTPSKDRRDRVRQKEKSRKFLQKLAAHKFRELRHGRGDKLSRSYSTPNSLLNTPKEKPFMESELRQVQSEMKKRRAAQLNMVAIMKNRERSNSLPNVDQHEMGIDTSSPMLPTPCSKPLMPPLSHSIPSNSLQSFMRQQRKIGGDAYDIDNIVIPYSMLASTRVERLTYKEIMTPKWREINYNSSSTDVADEFNLDEEENLSDTEFGERHAKCEIAERRKYMTLLAEQTWNHSRRGSRRSRNNSIGGTPEPCSPDAGVQDPVMTSSLDSSATSSPLPPDSQSVITRSSERRRASSAASDTHSEIAEDSSCVAVNPWCKRTFPLTDDQVEEFGEHEELVLPAEVPAVIETPIKDDLPAAAFVADKVSGTSTPDLESSDGEVPLEDPNDPEWTVITLDKPRRVEPSAAKTTLVLKLAKR